MNDSEAPIGLLTVGEVAERLRLTKQTVWKRIRAGQLKALSDGGMYRITEAELARYIAALPAVNDGAPEDDQN